MRRAFPIFAPWRQNVVSHLALLRPLRFARCTQPSHLSHLSHLLAILKQDEKDRRERRQRTPNRSRACEISTLPSAAGRTQFRSREGWGGLRASPAGSRPYNAPPRAVVCRSVACALCFKSDSGLEAFSHYRSAVATPQAVAAGPTSGLDLLFLSYSSHLLSAALSRVKLTCLTTV
jgi:hypothetical protein